MWAPAALARRRFGQKLSDREVREDATGALLASRLALHKEVRARPLNLAAKRIDGSFQRWLAIRCALSGSQDERRCCIHARGMLSTHDFVAVEGML